MRYLLENEILRVEIDSFGAEIKSVRRKDDNTEYMWYGDKKYWGRTSPVLFPFVGSVNNKEYRYHGKSYPMNQHGFARDLEHRLVSQSEDTIWFTLEETEDTMKVYPFRFTLMIGYTLQENRVQVSWKVKNPDTGEMYFAIGAHPAFLCPFRGEESKEGYYFRFEGASQINHYGNTPAGEALEDEKKCLSLEQELAEITPGFFDKCTYMIPDRQVKAISLLDREKNPYVTVKFDADLVALWSPEHKDAPFACIEPWYGRCDAKGFTGDLEDRPYENRLGAGETFTASYEMIFQK